MVEFKSYFKTHKASKCDVYLNCNYYLNETVQSFKFIDEYIQCFRHKTRNNHIIQRDKILIND